MLTDAQMLAESKMVECDGYVRWIMLKAFAEGNGAHIKGDKMANFRQ